MLNKYKLLRLLSFGRSISSGTYAIIVNTGWLFIDRILRMGMGLIVGIWVARYLGVQNYGLFNYATAFVALFSPLANLGLDNVVIRDIVRDSSCKAQILGTTFWLKLLGGIFSIVLPVIFLYLLGQNDNLTILLVVILASAAIFQAFDTIDLWFQSQLQSKYTVLAKNTAFIIATLFKVALIKLNAPLITFAWTVLAEIGLGAIGLVILYKFKGYSLQLWNWSFSVACSLLKESWPLMLSGLTIMIYMRIDQIMLGQMLDDSAVGIYSAATRISEVWYFIPMAIVSSVSPSIFVAKESSEALYYQRIEKLLRLLVLVSIMIAVPISFLSENIIKILFGNSYSAAAPILAVHIWASLFVFMGVAISSWFIAEGLTHLSLHRTLIGAIINVLLNLLLIPNYSGIGAAIATVISYTFTAFLANIIHPQTRKIFQLQVKSLLIFPQLRF